MGILSIIGLAALIAILVCLCYSCSRICKRKKPENRRKRRRQQTDSRRKRRRRQTNHSLPDPPSANPQTRIQITNTSPQQQETNTPNSSGIQATLPHLPYLNSSSPYPQFHNQPYLNLLSQNPQNQQFMLAQQQIPHMTAQEGDLYPFPPPPYEPPEQSATQRQVETRIAIPGVDINQFASRPPPPPYDEELQRSEPFKLN